MNGCQQIGIFGGSFNPITKAHIIIAQSIIQKTYIDQVFLTPCYEHTQKNKLADSSHRLEMCKIAVNGLNNLKVFDYEIKNQLSSGTYDFIQKLLADKELNEEREFSYIIGMDNVKIFNTWINYEQLKKTIRFIVVPRPGSKPLSETDWYSRHPHLCLNSPLLNMSSSHVRFLLKLWWKNIPMVKSILRSCILKEVDAKVLSYIESNGLYKGEK